MLEVCIVGLGALGTLYGFVIEKSGKARVTAVCRSNYDVVNSRGIDITSQKYGDFSAWKPSRVVPTTDDAADREYDFVVCTAKYIPDLISTTIVLGALLSHTSTFVLVQNGIGIHEELHKAVPRATIISACAWVDATVIDNGKVVKHGRVDRLVIGIHWPAEHPAHNTAMQTRLDILVDLLRTGGCNAVPAVDINAARWEKNLWNIGYSVFCTLTETNVATLLTDKWISTTTPVVRGFMAEAIEIARATGLSISDSAMAFAEETTLREYAQTYTERKEVNFTPVHFKPSMLVDFEARRPMEVEGIVGGVVRKGREAGVFMPRLETAYASLLLLQEPLLLSASRMSISGDVPRQ